MTRKTNETSLKALAIPALAALLGSACPASPALAATPEADRALYNVAVSTEHGTTTDCALSFIAGWTDDRQQAFAVVGTVTLTAGGGNKVGSTLKVRANMNKARRTISFAWMDVPGVGDTKGFTPPAPDQRGPFFSYSLAPDPQGPERLRAAAENGFVLGLRIIGLARHATVRLPAAPKSRSRN